MLCDFIAPWLAAAAVLAWELLDAAYSLVFQKWPYEMAKYFFWLDKIWDRRGLSWGDVLLGWTAVVIFCVKHHILF